MGTKKKVAKATTATGSTEAMAEVAQATMYEGATGDVMEARATDAGAQVHTGPTLNDVANGYLEAIEADDAGQGTLSSYKMELKIALRELGETTLLADLTAERVQAYFESDAVMKTRNGKPKAKPTFDKSRRVLRLALVWAQAAGLCDVAPVPAPKSKIAALVS